MKKINAFYCIKTPSDWKESVLMYDKPTEKNKTKPKLSTKILRFIVGIVTLGIIYAAGKSLQILLFADASQDVLYIIEYIRYTIVVLWGVAGAPFLFEHFGLN